jgi:hypothetical protein
VKAIPLSQYNRREEAIILQYEEDPYYGWMVGESLQDEVKTEFTEYNTERGLYRVYSNPEAEEYVKLGTKVLFNAFAAAPIGCEPTEPGEYFLWVDQILAVIQDEPAAEDTTVSV